MGRITTTIELAKASWRMLRRDRELLALPVLSFLVSLAVLVAFAVPIFLIGNDLSDTSEFDPGPVGYVLVVVMALTLTFVGVFFNAALVSGAHQRITGADPDIASALRGAGSRFHRLLPWALITGTVGLVLQALRDRAGPLGRFVVGLIGAAWEVVTFLVVPVLVIEDVGAFAGVKRSGELFRRTWGENLVAQAGFGILGVLVVLPAVVIAGVVAALGVAVLTVAAIAVAVVYVAVAVVVLTALSAVFQTALYHYAAHGVVVGDFEGTSLPASFQPKS